MKRLVQSHIAGKWRRQRKQSGVGDSESSALGEHYMSLLVNVLMYLYYGHFWAFICVPSSQYRARHEEAFSKDVGE